MTSSPNFPGTTVPPNFPNFLKDFKPCWHYSYNPTDLYDGQELLNEWQNVLEALDTGIAGIPVLVVDMVRQLGQ